MIQGVTVSRGMDLPFVPFTFDTVNFANLSKDLGHPLTWEQVDDIWDAYKAGKASGDMKSTGNTSAVASYLKSKVWWSRDTIDAWLDTADHAAAAWWGFGGNFVDFGGSAGPVQVVVDAAKSTVKGVSSAVGEVVKSAGKGLADGLGVPRWIFWGIAGLVALIALYLVFKVRYPKLSVS